MTGELKNLNIYKDRKYWAELTGGIGTANWEYGGSTLTKKIAVKMLEANHTWVAEKTKKLQKSIAKHNFGFSETSFLYSSQASSIISYVIMQIGLNIDDQKKLNNQGTVTPFSVLRASGINLSDNETIETQLLEYCSKTKKNAAKNILFSLNGYSDVVNIQDEAFDFDTFLQSDNFEIKAYCILSLLGSADVAKMVAKRAFKSIDFACIDLTPTECLQILFPLYYGKFRSDVHCTDTHNEIEIDYTNIDKPHTNGNSATQSVQNHIDTELDRTPISKFLAKVLYSEQELEEEVPVPRLWLALPIYFFGVLSNQEQAETQEWSTLQLLLTSLIPTAFIIVGIWILFVFIQALEQFLFKR